MNVPSLSSGATNLEGSATVDDVEIAPDSMGSTVEASTGTQSSTSAEAEIEAEAEAEAGNNAAAVAVVASGGSGAAGIGSAALASASTAGSVSTQDHAGIFHQNNDLTQIDGELTDRDDALSADVIADRSDNADGDQNAPGGAAEAEVEAEATAEADDPAFGNVTSGAGVTTGGDGDSLSTSSVQIAGDAGVDVTTSGLHDIGVRQIDGVSEGFEVAPANAAPSGTAAVETEAESEAEVEVEAEISFNAAAAGAAASGAIGHTSG